MKTLLLTLSLIIISFYGFSQDVIIKRDGKKIEAKIIEISTSTVKFKRHDQPDGPLRTLPKSDIKEIIYEDGSWDNFEEEVVKPNTDREESTPPPRREESSKDVFFDNGVNIDLLIGGSSNKSIYNWTNTYENAIYNPNTGQYEYVTVTESGQYDRSGSFFSIGFRLGTKFYISRSPKMRIGIQANWIRLGIHIDPDDPGTLFYGPKTLTPVNVGIASVFKFNENMGLEANLTGGYNVELDLDYGEFVNGIAFTPEIKFRYKNLAVGLDYFHVIGLSDNEGNNQYDQFLKGDWQTFSLNVGVKF